MMPSHHGEPGAGQAPAPILAGNVEREAAAQRLQAAFADHRLDEDEFDDRIRHALTARTTSELDGLTADLPASAPALVIAGHGGRPGRFAVALKTSISRVGRWTLPRRFFSVVYKGSGLLDLRAAQLTAPVTTITAISCKSRTEIVLPPGVALELGGTGVSAVGDGRAQAALPGAPVVRVKGVAYKGTVEVRTGASA